MVQGPRFNFAALKERGYIEVPSRLELVLRQAAYYYRKQTGIHIRVTVHRVGRRRTVRASLA